MTIDIFKPKTEILYGKYFWKSMSEFIHESLIKNESHMTNNVIELVKEGTNTRFIVNISDFGCIIAAMNRLIQKNIPTFYFPINKSSYSQIMSLTCGSPNDLKSPLDRLVSDYQESYGIDRSTALRDILVEIMSDQDYENIYSEALKFPPKEFDIPYL